MHASRRYEEINVNRSMNRLFGSHVPSLCAIVFGVIFASVAYYYSQADLQDEADQASGFIDNIHEIFINCGPTFAIPLSFFLIAGVVYLLMLCITQWIPNLRSVQSGIDPAVQALFDQLAQPREPENTEKTETKGEKHPKGVTKDDKIADLIESGQVGDNTQERNDSQEDTISKSKFDSDQLSAKGRTQEPEFENKDELNTEQGGEQEQTVVNNETKSKSDLIHQTTAPLHPWLRNRLIRVITALWHQGPEAARSENQILSEQDEDRVATGLLPAQVCMWILPLLGFVGTVWGLHNAIPNLKDGVETMTALYTMDASSEVKSPGSSTETQSAKNKETDKRQKAMAQFGNGFKGLQIAFDTTLVGLTGVIFVGLLLYYTRRRAMVSLARVNEITEETVRQCPVPRESIGELLETIRKTVREGLIDEQEEGQVPLMADIREAVQRGLLTTGESQKEPTSIIGVAAKKLSQTIQSAVNSAGDTFEKEANSTRKVMHYGTEILGKINMGILKENQLQSLFQWKSIAPNLRDIRNRICDVKDCEEGYLIEPSISKVFELPLNDEIHALAIANGASKACVGGLHKDINASFVQESSIEWTQGSFTLSRGIHFVTDNPLDDSKEELKKTQHIDAKVVALTYDPQAKKLFTICVDGVPRIWLK